MRYGDILRKMTGLVLLGFFLSLGFFHPVQSYFNIPHQITLFNHQSTTVSSPPAATHLSIDNNEVASAYVSGDSLHVSGKQTGHTEMLFTVGNFPVKKVDVNVLPDIKLIPGGQSIGVKLNSVGVLVVGYHLVDTNNGEKSPGEKAGIKVGDIITKINGEKIESMSDVKQVVRKAGETGETLKVTVQREQNTMTKKLVPIKDKESGKYRIGLYIRDSAAGIGTLTFYDPKTGKYGALGHVISDMDTKEPIVVHDGSIIRSKVTAIDKGENGQPGEKIATISPNQRPLGTITKNTPFGIFGKLNHSIDNRVIDKPLPITLPKQVEEGPAKILTVIEGNKVESFDIKIVNSVPQKIPATKGLVIKITDPELLKKTGGIVQGMSGSPIIQNGKIVGAVTHVFVNDPTMGYGCHIEWMLKEAGIDIYQDQQERKEAS